MTQSMERKQNAAVYDMRLPLARNMIISGPSLSGKSYFLSKLLKDTSVYFTPTPTRVLWYFGEIQPKPILPRVEYKRGLPTEKDIELFHRCIIVLDDLMLESKSSLLVANLFTRVAHHRECFIVHVTQNLFQNGSITRTQSLNAHYFVLFKNPRDKLQITYLARQIYPQNIDFFLASFEDATSKPFGYLFLDLAPATPEDLRVRSNILLGDKQYSVYLPTNNHVYKEGFADFSSTSEK